MSENFIMYKNRDLTNKQRLGIMVIFIWMLIDYMLTYYGMYELNFITEGNAAMIHLMELPFIAGFMLRVVQSFIVSALLYITITFDTKTEERQIFKFLRRNITTIALLLNLAPFLAHANWIYHYNFIFAYL